MGGCQCPGCTPGKETRARSSPATPRSLKGSAGCCGTCPSPGWAGSPLLSGRTFAAGWGSAPAQVAFLGYGQRLVCFLPENQSAAGERVGLSPRAAPTDPGALQGGCRGVSWPCGWMRGVFLGIQGPLECPTVRWELGLSLFGDCAFPSPRTAITPFSPVPAKGISRCWKLPLAPLSSTLAFGVSG